MKKILFVLVATMSISFFSSCNKDKDIQSDDLLIQEIASAENKIIVEPAELPSSVNSLVEKSFFESYLETAHKAPAKGFEIIIGNEDKVYFNLEGRLLRPRRKRHACGGNPQNKITIEELPSAITDYITENYPDVEIKRAKQLEDKYIVGLANHTLLIFDADGNFIEEGSCFKHHCRGKGTPIAIEELSATITDYITENYPDAEIKKARQKGNKIIVGLLVNGERVILGFDNDGNLIFTR